MVSPLHTPQATMLATFSDEMVRLYKRLFGRGPTKARTSWAGSNLLVCTLEDLLTSAERTLIAMGEAERVRETRSRVQSAWAGEFSAVVERVTGREVRASVSGVDPLNDVAVEAFVLRGREAVSELGEDLPDTDGAVGHLA